MAAGPDSREWLFLVPGLPVAKGRPRFARVGPGVRTYTPAQTVRYEDTVRLVAQAAGVRPLVGPVGLEIVAWWACKGPPRKREPRPAAWKSTRPDAENVAKTIMDALNGIAYADDGQVAELMVRKKHAAQGDVPRAAVRVYGLPH